MLQNRGKHNIFLSIRTQERNFCRWIVLISIIDFILLVNHLSGRPLPTLAVNRRTELHYNLGLSLLHSGQPAKAFDCFIESRSSFQCNPRYWLRLAECCVALDKQVRQCFCQKAIKSFSNSKNTYLLKSQIETLEKEVKYVILASLSLNLNIFYTFL